jgi:hypothetical protein
MKEEQGNELKGNKGVEVIVIREKKKHHHRGVSRGNFAFSREYFLPCVGDKEFDPNARDQAQALQLYVSYSSVY